MCQKIYSHSTVCDVRTIVVGENPDEAYVDPYAEPRSCSCNKPDACIRPWLRCSYHKCCRVSVTWIRCRIGNDICPEPTLYHKYEQASSARSLAQSHTDINAITRNRWPSVPVLDAQFESIGKGKGEFVPNSELFIARRTMMCCYGRLNFESLLDSLRAQQEIEDIQSETYCEHHDICKRVLLDWECPASRAEGRIQEITQRLRQLEQNRAGYRVQFSRWKSRLLQMISRGEGHCAGLVANDARGHLKTDQRCLGKGKLQLSITVPKNVKAFVQVELVKVYIPAS